MIGQPNKENIRKWVDALESGEYEQCTGRLRKDDEEVQSFCCLGVVTDLYAKETGEKWFAGYDELPSRDHLTDSEMLVANAGGLPNPVYKWLGLSSIDPELDIDSDGHTEAATTLNDSRGWSFKQIAQAIRRTYLGDSHE